MRCIPKLGRGSIAIGLLLALSARPAAAQLLPPVGQTQPVDFMTVLVFESDAKSYARLLFAPAFNGRTEIALEGLNTLSIDKAFENQRQNAETLSCTLSELSAVGWELVEVHSLPWTRDKAILTTRYLLRRPRK